MKTNTSVELQLLVNGRPVTTYGREGRTFVEGREGNEFSLRVRNNTASRVEAVVSVDGRSVVDGEPATPGSAGYIISAYGSYEIPGWRMTSEACAKFVFKKPGESYAAKSGSSVADTGVIGLMAWAEKVVPAPAPVPIIINQPYPVYHPVYYPVPLIRPYEFPHYQYSTITCGGLSGHTTAAAILRKELPSNTNSANVVTAYNCSADLTAVLSAASANSCAPESAPEFKLGTGWGDKVHDAISYTSFTRGELLVERELYYSDAAALRAIGVELDKPVAIPTAGSVGIYPSAFKFCRPPA
jgi:hypothetical protein